MPESHAPTIDVAGVSVVLRPERALWVPVLSTLFVADLHWGKAAAFRAAHVPVPTGTTAADLARLTAVLQSTGAQRLVILGDMLHARHGRHADTMDTIAEWRHEHASLDLVLVRGNHDEHAGDPPHGLRITCMDTLRLGPFVARHEPGDDARGYVLAGHLHPHVSLGGRGGQHVRLPCFVFGVGHGVLPAFSSFTGRGMYERVGTDRIYAIAEGTVLAVNPSRRSRTR